MRVNQVGINVFKGTQSTGFRACVSRAAITHNNLIFSIFIGGDDTQKIEDRDAMAFVYEMNKQFPDVEEYTTTNYKYLTDNGFTSFTYHFLVCLGYASLSGADMSEYHNMYNSTVIGGCTKLSHFLNFGRLSNSRTFLGWSSYSHDVPFTTMQDPSVSSVDESSLFRIITRVSPGICALARPAVDAVYELHAHFALAKIGVYADVDYDAIAKSDPEALWEDSDNEELSSPPPTLRVTAPSAPKKEPAQPKRAEEYYESNDELLSAMAWDYYGRMAASAIRAGPGNWPRVSTKLRGGYTAIQRKAVEMFSNTENKDIFHSLIYRALLKAGARFCTGSIATQVDYRMVPRKHVKTLTYWYASSLWHSLKAWHSSDMKDEDIVPAECILRLEGRYFGVTNRNVASV